MSLAVFARVRSGAGLLGELAVRAGWPVVFIEKQPEFARQLAAAGQYTVRLVGRGESVTRVTNYRVLTASDTATMAAAVRDCELAATAVGGEQLGVVAGLLAPALRERAKALPVLVCENWSRSGCGLDGGVDTGRGGSRRVLLCAGFGGTNGATDGRAGFGRRERRDGPGRRRRSRCPGCACAPT